MPTGKVILSGMAFYGYHGYYSEENKLGNHYVVDLKVTTNFEVKEDELEGTINYEILYKLTEKVMLTPYKLLETLGYKIVQAVFNKFPTAEAVQILIKKKQPPIGALCDYAAVELTLRREELV
ncbi:MAG: dihydroneopterin aldolase [Marivirga sp.]|jgi:dihydroneopterin aldolase